MGGGMPGGKPNGMSFGGATFGEEDRDEEFL